MHVRLQNEKKVIYNETKDQKVKLAFFTFLTFHPKNANLPGNNQKRTKISPPISDKALHSFDFVHKHK